MEEAYVSILKLQRNQALDAVALISAQNHRLAEENSELKTELEKLNAAKVDRVLRKMT